MTLPPEPLPERPAVVLLRGRSLAFWLFALDERGGHDDLCGLGHLSIIPYVHGRTELYFCSSLPCLSLFYFSSPWKWRLPEPFIAQGRVATMSPQGPTGGLGVGEPYTVGHNG
jgi:hypothetical protein